MYYPTWVDVSTFVGTIGIFVTLFLLFIRFLPMVAISEVRSVLPQADPHYEPVGPHTGAEDVGEAHA